MLPRPRRRRSRRTRRGRPFSPSSTNPTPPGVIGIEPRIRASVQAANASTIVTSARGTPTARTEATRTRKTVRCPASVAAVRESQRRRIRLDRLPAKAHEGCAVPLDGSLVDQRLGTARQPGGTIADAAREARARQTDGEADDDRREGCEADRSQRARACGCSHPARRGRRWRGSGSRGSRTGSRRSARQRRARRGGPSKPHARSIANDVAIPTAAPPGATDDSAVDASVTRVARKYEMPGSAATRGGP